MLDDKDGFTTTEELKADMELASIRGFVSDVFQGQVWFKAIDDLGKHNFIKYQLQHYAADLDKALKLMVWDNA